MLLLDASTIINLFNGRVLKVSLVLPFSFGFGPRVEVECDNKLLKYIEEEKLPIQRIDESRISSSTFLDLTVNEGLGVGEAECIAYALNNTNSVVLTDDLKARRMVERRIGKDRLSGSLGILKCLVSKNQLTADQAFCSYSKMVLAGGFLPKLESNFFVK